MVLKLDLQSIFGKTAAKFAANSKFAVEANMCLSNST